MKERTPEFRRRCKRCKLVYHYAFHFAGIPRCPRCWGYEFECIEYIDSKGNVIDCEPYKPIAEPIPCIGLKDKGCDIATDFLGRKSKCTDNCPYQKCLDELPFNDREYIKQWRMMLRVYKLTDKGLCILRITRSTGLAREVISEWLERRDYFESFIKQPVTAGNRK